MIPDVVIHIRLDTTHDWLRPGDILTGSFSLAGVTADEVAAVELSVLWHTEGKGDEDLAVHLFQRFSADDAERIDPKHPVRFSTQLPLSPLSYDGVLIKIRWCARVRVFLQDGQEVVEERPFRLGRVPRPEIDLPSSINVS